MSAIPKDPVWLARISKGVAMLAEARTLEDVKNVRAVAAAAIHYAKAKELGAEAVAYATEIQLRAARKAGELLREAAEKAERATNKGGDRKSRSQDGTVIPPTLSDLGVTKKESSRWQAIAAIPEKKFEQILRDDTPTSEAALARVAKPGPALRVMAGWDKETTLLHGHFLSFCRAPDLLGDPREAARRLSSIEKYDSAPLLEGARLVAEWLTAFITEWTKRGNK